MQKLLKNTILLISIILCISVFALNIIYTSELNNSIEQVIKNTNGIFYLIIVVIIMFLIKKIIDVYIKLNISNKTKKIVFIIIMILYLVFQIIWIYTRNIEPTWDQKEAYNAAVEIYNGNIEILKENQYFELHSHQLTLSLIYVVIFNIFNSTNFHILQIINSISNVLVVLSVILISKHMSKSYNVKKSFSFLISILFIVLPLLSTFIYGDILSLPLCMFSIYFIMKYTYENKLRYAIISSVLISIAYMARMNNLIFIIAIFIYLILNILDNKKEILKKIIVLFMFLLISLLPCMIIKTNLQKYLNLNKNKGFPITGYLYMGMSQDWRGNGWYNESAKLAFEDIESSKIFYRDNIKKRVKYLVANPIYTFKFYTVKTITMWTENTYGSIWYNRTFDLEKENKNIDVKSLKVDETLNKSLKYIEILMKALILIIYGKIIFLIIKKKSNLSNDVLLLLTVFIGGFLFHTLWEAKSRYIIPYIVVLIPLVSINIDEYINKIK